ncbi:hypothetical protein PPYR_06312 [Photinus pyralis]|uniref:HECT domain-containing protein n=1 Tax=Photinus pyralis TaxID=7054 RepID=A0A5N4AT73_PHOPY|nr:hypothetical protein PPYR_06312 [Photinus pyralis]
MSELEDFLKRHNVPEEVVQNIIAEQISEEVINMMSDTELKTFLPAYGHRKLVREFCLMRAPSTSKQEASKQSLLEKIRSQIFRGNKNDEESVVHTKKKIKYNSEKSTRNIEMGWLHEDGNKIVQVRSKKGGGTRKLTVEKSAMKQELIEAAQKVFFPNGFSPKGNIEDFDFDLLDFKHNEYPPDISISQILNSTKVKVLRFYLKSERKNINDEDLDILQELQNRNNIFCNKDRLINRPNLEDLNAENQFQQTDNIQTLTLHRGKIFEELIEAFQKHTFHYSCALKIEMILPNGETEYAEDVGGVFRDTLSEFWSSFYEKCSVGTNLKIPYLRHDFNETQWKAIASIFLKGFTTESYIPIKIAPVFILSCLGCAIQDEDLIQNFLHFVCESEREILRQALLDFDNVDSDELLDIFSNYDAKWIPTKTNINLFLRDIAHKELIQKPAFVIKCFGQVFQTHSRISTSEIMALFNNIKPSSKNCLAKIHLQNANETTPQITEIYGYLKKFIKEVDDSTRSAFFRFCTGSDLPTRDIYVSIINTTGFGRVPIGHTCSGLLELPSSYENFVVFRSEMTNILQSNVWVMDIV